MGSLNKDEDLIVEDGWSKDAILYVNGDRHVLPDGLAHLTLLQYLRGICFCFLFLFKDFLKLIPGCLSFGWVLIVCPKA